MTIKVPRWLDKKVIPRLRVRHPRPGRWVRPHKIKWRDEHVLHRRGWTSAPIGPTELETRAVPRTTVLGSVEERIVYKELTRRRVPFDFQSSFSGGRLEFGGMVADFILLDRMVIIRVQGTRWHTSFPAEKRDEAQKAVLQGFGYTVLDLWDYVIHDAGRLHDWFARNIGATWR